MPAPESAFVSVVFTLSDIGLESLLIEKRPVYFSATPQFLDFRPTSLKDGKRTCKYHVSHYLSRLPPNLLFIINKDRPYRTNVFTDWFYEGLQDIVQRLPTYVSAPRNVLLVSFSHYAHYEEDYLTFLKTVAEGFTKGGVFFKGSPANPWADRCHAFYEHLAHLLNQQGE